MANPNPPIMGKFKVAIIQGLSRASLSDVPSVEITRELLDLYLDEDVLSFESNDANKIFEWIMHNAKKKKIYKYALSINSALTNDLINIIAERKINSRKARCLLKKCIFVNGYSNADSVRELNILKNTKIYFYLSRLTTVLTNIQGLPSNKNMLVVSDSVTPYFTQVYDVIISPKCRVSELTSGIINEFVDKGGYKIVTSLATESEYEKVVSEVNKSNFQGEMCAIELDYPDKYVFEKENDVITTTISSGVSICGDIDNSPGLNEYLKYSNATLTVMYNCKSWRKLIKSNVLSVGKSESAIAITVKPGLDSASGLKFLTFASKGVGTAIQTVLKKKPIIEVDEEDIIGPLKK